MRLDGRIEADGETGTTGGFNGGGAGAGGTIALTAGPISGAGALSANGGASAGAVGHTGAGGGGRIAVTWGTNLFGGTNVFVGSNTFTGLITAFGGSTQEGERGGAGTIVLRDLSGTNPPAASVIVDNGTNWGSITPLSTSEPFHLFIANHGRVTCETNLLLNRLVMSTNSELLHLPGWPAPDLEILGDAEIAAGAVLNVTQSGFGPDNGPGRGGSGSWNGRGGGGGHGGVGGSSDGAPGGAAYGSYSAPVEAGSSGGSGSGHPGVGAAACFVSR